MQEAIDEAAKKLRREGEIFRKGVIESLDTDATPNMAVVNGRPMPVLGASLAVGDIVVYVDQPDPFAISKFAGT